MLCEILVKSAVLKSSYLLTCRDANDINVTRFNVFNVDLRVLYFVVDVADYSDVSISAFIQQRSSSHLGRQLLDGDSGSIVETRLGQTDLQPGVRPQRFVDDIPTAQQQAQQTTGGRHLVAEQGCPLLPNW